MIVEAKFVAYAIRNKVNGKGYVGITSRGFARRWSDHCSRVKNPHKDDQAITRAMRKYGIDSFEITVLASSSSFDDLKLLETQLILQERTRSPDGYNETDGGDGCLGRECTAVTRARMSAAVSATVRKEENRRALSEKSKAAWRDPDKRKRLLDGLSKRVIRDPVSWKQRISQTQKGRVKSEEERRNIAAALTGKKRPETVKEKIRAKAVGRKATSEARRKMSASRKGVPKSEAHKLAMRQAWEKRRISENNPVAAAKRSEAVKRGWVGRKAKASNKQGNDENT